MSNIDRALNSLKKSIGRLEGGIDRLVYTKEGQQRDMFSSAPVGAATRRQEPFPLENAVIAQRLDKAIQKVEELLEG